MTALLAPLLGGKGFAPLAVVASNVSRTETGAGSSGTVTTTQSPNTTASGGVAPYTAYAWTYVSGSTDFNIAGANVQNPNWSGEISSGTSEAIWRVTVTDTVSATATFDITVSLTWIGDF